MNLFELTAKISMDTREYEKAVKGATKESKSLSAIMEKAATKSETNKNKVKLLADEYKTAKAKVAELTAAFNKSAKETGVASKETKELAEKLKDAERDAAGLASELDGLKKKTISTKDAFSKFSSGLGKGLAGAAKIGAKAIAGMAAGIAAAGTALVATAENTREYRNEMAKLDTAFTTMGHSSEAAYGAYSDLQSVLGESDQAVEAASHLAKLTDNEQDLEKWTHTLTGVYATFGASLPIEGLTEAA